MSKALARGQYWFTCVDCGRQSIRHSNARKCQHCNGPLARVKQATAEECKAQVDEALRKHREIPE